MLHGESGEQPTLDGELKAPQDMTVPTQKQNTPSKVARFGRLCLRRGILDMRHLIGLALGAIALDLTLIVFN